MGRLPIPLGDGELAEIIEAHCRWEGRRPNVARLERRGGHFPSTSAIEEVRVVDAAGRRTTLIVKDCQPDHFVPGARGVKPRFLLDPERELRVYQEILFPLNMGTPALLGAACDRRTRAHLLFFERVAGRPLFEVGDWKIWESAARWLARFHARSRTLGRRGDFLLRQNEPFLRRWMSRALRFARKNGDLRKTRLLSRLQRGHARIAARLAEVPAAVLHGDFYASNILVRRSVGRGGRICPVDWEMASVGPPVLDLAALVAGRLPPGRRETLVEAYYGEALRLGAPVPEAGEFNELLAGARLQIAIQWLGWSEKWEAPPDHRHDWSSDIESLARGLGSI